MTANGNKKIVYSFLVSLIKLFTECKLQICRTRVLDWDPRQTWVRFLVDLDLKVEDLDLVVKCSELEAEDLDLGPISPTAVNSSVYWTTIISNRQLSQIRVSPSKNKLRSRNSFSKLADITTEETRVLIGAVTITWSCDLLFTKLVPLARLGHGK